VLDVAELFGDRHPGCEVEIRENQLNDGLTPLRAGDIDVLFLMLPVEEPDLVTGPVLVRERRLLAVSDRHPLVRRPTIGVEDLAADVVLTAPAELPEYVRRHVVPERTPGGAPVRPGPAFATVQEMLSLIGAGRGVYPVPAQTAVYYARPDVAYLPITDARPFEWALTWRRDTENRRVRAFATAAKDLVRRRSGKPVLAGFDPS
jgi:DNA-binding transcriptional LysR family regulator